MLNKKYDVCVFGGCSLDLTYFQNEDLSYNDVPDVIVLGGKGANQAVAASRAGAKVSIISRIGEDSVGKKILDNLQYNNVFTAGVEVVLGLVNDTTDIYIEKDTKDNKIVRTNGAIDSFYLDMVLKYSDVLLSSKIVVAQMKIPKEVSVGLINFCYENKIPIIVTPCRPNKLSVMEDSNSLLMDKITYITANRSECEAIFGTNDIEMCVKKYPNKLIVTLGDKGVMYHDGKKVVYINALNVDNIVDTTGAGDTFNGNLAYCLTHGYNLKDAVERSQYASAYKLMKKTAQSGMPWKDELDDFIKNYNAGNFEYNYEFDAAYNAIINAYELIENVNVKVSEIKSDYSFVTESDLIVENAIVRELVSKFPTDNFLTEESYSNNRLLDRTWVIDPIDGTNHYMKNSIFWGIQLAFVDKQNTMFSIIYLPKINEMYYAIKNNGVYLNNKRINTVYSSDAAHSIIEFCGSLDKFYDEKKKLLDYFLKDFKFASGYMHINSCSFAFANLISGKTDALILSTKKPWDIIPGMLFCEECGFDEIKLDNLIVYTKVKEIKDKVLIFKR